MIRKIPSQVIEVLEKIEKAGFEAYIVGGCVRDLLCGKEPKDWDLTTNAKPNEILDIFGKENSFYENDFGTVGVKIMEHGAWNTEQEDEKKKKKIVEVTTYRIESKYSDKRRPDEVKFAETLEEDLSRRDFTVNAISLRITNYTKLRTGENGYEIVDLFGGQEDIKKKIIRAVGDASERFDEDALRMMRAVRFAAQLSTGKDLEFIKDRSGKGKENKHHHQGLWSIGEKTFAAIKKHKDLLQNISKERIRDEFEKIILSERPAWGVELLVETGLMENIIPEIYDTIGVNQNRHHYHGPFNTVYKHMLAALKTCPSKKLEVRLAAFLHDIGKPQSKRGKGEFATFYQHEYIGARMTKKILERLKFSKKVVDKTVLLVKNHMFYYNVDEVGEKGVRKVVTKVGLENINDLIDVRIGDRLGSGVSKAVPYKLRHFKYMVEKVSSDPLSAKQLKINGNDLIKELKVKPGPIIGDVLDVLLAEVIDDPTLNDREILLDRAKELAKEKNNLEKMDEVAKKKIKEKQKEEDKKVKGKYWVK